MANVPIQIGHYRLGKTLGIGSFGKVKLAEHEITGHKVAIKILNRSKIKSLELQDKVRREISILRRVTHPHIIRLYEVIDTPTDIFVVMEYVSGGELFDYIVSKGRLSQEEARHFFHQIIAGVEYCHFHGVVHRDLKPENLLLDADNNVKIADFGLSNIMRDGCFLITSCGSPNYAAPEVISGNMYAGPEVDVWSCGVILYALLCGSLPFDDDSIPSLFKKIKSGQYSLPSHLGDEARDLIMNMLVVDSMRRITIPEIRQHRWFQVGLPPYLQSPPELTVTQVQEVDLAVLAVVVQLFRQKSSSHQNITEERVRTAIMRGDRNELRVCYDLLLENQNAARRVKELQNVNAKDHQPQTFGSSTGSPDSLPQPPVHSHLPQLPPVPGSMPPPPEMMGVRDRSVMMNAPMGYQSPATMVGMTSMPHRGRFPPVSSLMNPGTPNSILTSQQPRRRWYLGIQSKKETAHVMSEVYRALDKLSFEWKILGPYKIICRWSDNVSKKMLPTAKEAVNSSSLKIGLQLYKVQQHIYLLDFQKLDGNAFIFMNLCARIITELKTLSAATRQPDPRFGPVGAEGLTRFRPPTMER